MGKKTYTPDLLYLWFRWVSHVVAVVAWSRAQHGGIRQKVEPSDETSCGHAAWSGGDGGVRAPEPLRHMAPSQVEREAGRPPTG